MKRDYDPDMFHKAQDIAQRAKMLGFQVSVVKSDRDPKERSYQQLHEILK